MHREIFRRNREAINAAVVGYTEAFRRYEREFAERVQTYQRRASYPTLAKAIARSDIVYVADYHTLPQAQRGCLRLLRRLDPDQPVTLALEFVQGRYQAAIDAYLAGELDDDGFLEAIDHHRHWVFGGWESFRPFFELARERGYRVIGIDQRGRGGAGTSLHARDNYAARRLVAARRQHPDHLMVVLMGELHVSPNHLPARVEALTPKGMRPPRPLVIYQNCENIYWQLEARGREHDTELVQISPREFCLLNTPPIVCQQSFLNWLHAEDNGIEPEAVEENFREYVRLLTTFFDLDLGDAVDEVEVATVMDLSFLARLKQRGEWSEAELARLQEQILASESYYIPKARMVYLGNLSVNHAAEEATHFIRHVCAEGHEPRLLVDAFYWRALEEAVGFLGSKVINHKRKCAHLPQMAKLYRSRQTNPFDKEVARLVLKHGRITGGKRVRGLSEVYECDMELFNAVTHAVGYMLGDRLYYGLVSGRISKSEIRDLFYDPFSGEGDALSTYLYLASITADVALPERL